MSHFSSRRLAMFLLWIAPIAMSSAQGTGSAARELARRIAGSLSPGLAVSPTFENKSSLSPAGAAEARRAMEAALREAGFEIRSDGVKTVVTLSENASGAVWIAEVIRDEQRDVFLVSGGPPAASGAFRVVLEAEELFETPEAILDVANSEDRLIALQPSGVSIYEHKETGWERGQNSQIPNPPVWPRDTRGRLVAEGGAFRAYLPGLICNGSTQPSLTIECSKGNRWPTESSEAEFAAERNYFTADGAAPFYSSATISSEQGELRLLAGVDGGTYVLDASMRQLNVFDGWGDDIASIDSECGRVVVVSGIGEQDKRDTVQAYELIAGYPARASRPVQFDGLVTALWTSGDSRSVTAVVHDLEKQTYAAYRVSARCTR